MQTATRKGKSIKGVSKKNPQPINSIASIVTSSLSLTPSDAPLWRLPLGWLRLAGGALRERALWTALGVGLLLILLAYQSPRAQFVNIGGAFDTPHVPGFFERESVKGADFRWAGASSAMLFEGMGKPFGSTIVRLQLSSGRGAGSPPVEVAVRANGQPLPSLNLTTRSESYVLSISPELIGPSGDLSLDFSSPTFRIGNDRRDLGFLADFARVEMPVGLTLPSLTQVIWLLLSAVLIYMMMRAVWVRPIVAGMVTGGFLLSAGGFIGVQRLLLTVFTGRLALTLLLAVLLAMVGELLVRIVARAAGWRGREILPEWCWAGLRGLLMLSVVLKVGGVLYPHSFIIDAPFHLKYVTLMSEGRPWDQYFGRSLALSVMPQQEWGSARAFIPYSPFFYVIAAPLTALPVPLETSVPVASAIFEALKGGLVFLVGLALSGVLPGERRSALAGRRALVAAFVYSFIPATFLLQQFGTWPTLISLWLLTFWAAFTFSFWRHITHPLIWIASTGALTLTMLSYTVTNLYTGIFIGMALVAGWFLSPGDRRRWAAIALSGGAALLLSVWAYYGQYFITLIQETLPTFAGAIENQGKLTTLRPSLGAFLVGHLGRAMQSYNLAMIFALGLAGALWVFCGSGGAGASRGVTYGVIASVRKRKAQVSWQKVWLGAWLLTLPLFTIADFYVDQAFKEFWYPFPAIALVAAVWMLALYARGRTFRALAVLLCAVLLWQSLSLWVFRLLFH